MKTLSTPVSKEARHAIEFAEKSVAEVKRGIINDQRFLIGEQILVTAVRRDKFVAARIRKGRKRLKRRKRWPGALLIFRPFRPFCPFFCHEHRFTGSRRCGRGWTLRIAL